jgi:ABC-2 type transport system ATP-binding protein
MDDAARSAPARPTDAQPAVSVRDLRKAYGETVAVDGISFDVAPGEIFGVIGPNGSGKTTTVECAQGLRRADGGMVRVLGLDRVTSRTRLRRESGSQLQESALPDRIRVWEALDLFAALAPEADDVDRLLSDWGLAEKRRAPFASLSGGQRQRLFVALALVTRPKVVFLDEMTTGLDPSARRIAWELIAALRERGTTVLLVTHFMDEAERLCNRVAVVSAGKVVALGTPPELIGAHAGATSISFTPPPGELDWLHRVDGVDRVRRDGERVEVEGHGPVVATLGAALVERGTVPGDLRVVQGTLEEVFLRLTGGGEG